MTGLRRKASKIANGQDADHGQGDNGEQCRQKAECQQRYDIDGRQKPGGENGPQFLRQDHHRQYQQDSHIAQNAGNNQQHSRVSADAKVA